MLFNRVYEKEYRLLVQRKDLSDDKVIAISHAESFCNRVEDIFLRHINTDFYDSCSEALSEMSDTLNKNGMNLNFNAMIPIIYKYWLYSEEFEDWLNNNDEDEFLLINV